MVIENQINEDLTFPQNSLPLRKFIDCIAEILSSN